MNSQNFTTTFLVDQSPEEVFNAINNVRGWWSEDVEGNTDTLGGEFTFFYQELHHSQQKIVELVPGKKVSWLVVESCLSFIKDTNEWTGTEISFDIATKGTQTEVRFTHVGLVPEFECFNDCSNGWGFYVNGSLRSLITTGKGQPNERVKGDGVTTAS